MNKGGCLCRAVRFQVNAEPVFSGKCYCRDCQYISGGEPAAFLVVPRDSLLVEGEVRVYSSQAESGHVVHRSFCSVCGTPLFGSNEGPMDFVSVKVGALDDPSIFANQRHIWTASAQPWHVIDDSISHVPRNPS